MSLSPKYPDLIRSMLPAHPAPNMETPPYSTPLSRPLLRRPWVSGWGRLAQLRQGLCCHKQLGWQPLTLHNVPLTGHRATSWVTSLQQAAPGEAEPPTTTTISQSPLSPTTSSSTPAHPLYGPGKCRDRRGRWGEEVFCSTFMPESMPGSLLRWACHC